MSNQQTMSYNRLKRLGWLNTQTRKTLLSRYCVRLIPDFLVHTRMLGDENDQSTEDKARLDIYRFLLELEYDIGTGHRQIDAPYQPAGRPDTYFLRGGRSNVELQIRTQFEMPLIQLSGNAWGFSMVPGTPSYPTDQAFVALAREIQLVSKGTNLSTKSVADDRAKSLFGSSHRTNGFDTDFINSAGYAARTIRATLHEKWTWWREWYAGLFLGKHIEWLLAESILEIDQAEWAKGSERIAELIAGIEAGLLKARVPLTEEIVFDEDLQKFQAKPIQVQNAPLLQVIVQRV